MRSGSNRDRGHGGDMPIDALPAVLQILFQAWQAADERYLGAPPGSPESIKLLAEATQLWEAYEKGLGKAIGRGTLRTARAGTA